MKTFEQLNKPYPIVLNRWKVVLSISFFIPLFLIIYEPFGLNDSQIAHKYLFILEHGLVTFLVLVINVFFLPATFKTFFSEAKWTVLKQIFWFLWNVITIGVSNYILAKLISGNFDIRLSELIFFVFISIMISIIPLSFLTLLTYNRLLKKNLSVSKEISDELNKPHLGTNIEYPIILYSENKRNQLETTSEKLLFIESVGNYVTVWHLRNAKTQCKTIRNTIKNIEKQLKYSKNIFKVHRAFIINNKYIESIKGNSQGYRLRMKHSDKEVIVARNYINELKKRISNIDLHH
jgi:LytTr DNA-binding domain-containing protein